MDARISRLARIERLLTQLRATAGDWRPLLEAVIELAAEVKEIVQGEKFLYYVLCICLDFNKLLELRLEYPEGMVWTFTHEEPSSFETLESEISTS